MTDQKTIDVSDRSGSSDTRERILDAAEIEFSKNGFNACSLRAISVNHDINLGLIHYYFRSKKRLFTETFMRRSVALVERRNGLLAEARERANDQPIDVAEIARCFVTPTVAMIKAGGGPRAYIRIQGLLRTDTTTFARQLRADAFSATNKIFIREMQRSCPHLSPTTVVWRFSAMIGAFYALISQNSRVHELSDGAANADDIDEAVAQVIPFIVGGFAAPPPKA